MPFQLSRRHQLLLRAVLAEPDTAADAYAHWRESTSLHEADPEEASVVPLLASRLHDLRAPDDAGRLRGVRRHAVVRQFAIRTEMAAAAEALHTGGIPPVAIKGLALAAAYGAERTRAVGDADVLVPHDAVEQAVDRLLAAGFELAMGVRREHITVWAARFHAVPMRRPGQMEVDVHWRLSHQPWEAGPGTAPIFSRAVASGDDGWLVPHPAHQLAVAVAHGWPSTSAAALRMLVDLAVLVDQPGLDPSLIDEIVGPHRLRAALRTALAMLGAEGVRAAARLLDRLPTVRPSDRVAAHLLRANRDGVGTRLLTAAAYRRATIARRPPAAALDPVRPADPAAGATVSLCGQGWWLGDGWATWTRRHVATLRVAPPSDSPRTLHLSLASSPGRGLLRRRVVVIGSRPRVVRLHPTSSATVQVQVPLGRTTVVRVVSPRFAVPHEVVANGDHRRLGVALTALQSSAGETGNHHR